MDVETNLDMDLSDLFDLTDTPGEGPKNTEDKYLKRGEFGELMLYHLLHEYFNADALISKIYFKEFS